MTVNTTPTVTAMETARSFAGENPLLEHVPQKFRLNRLPGRRDVAKLATIVGVYQVIKRHEFPAPDVQTS